MNINAKTGSVITPQQIAEYFEEQTGVSLEEIRSSDSTKRVVTVRKAMMPVLKELCNFRNKDFMQFYNKICGVIGNYKVNVTPLQKRDAKQIITDLTRTVKNFRQL